MFLQLVVAIDASWHLRGEEHTETGTPAGSVSDLDAATVRANDGPANCEPEPVAGDLRLLRRLSAEEWLEYALAFRSGDAGSLVLHRELQFAIVNDPCGDTDFGALGRVLDRVLDQIREHALDLAPIHPNGMDGR